VIPVWRAAMAATRPVRITDVEATRFWMTQKQAVELVLHGCWTAEPLLVPELPAYRLGDLAKALDVASHQERGGNFHAIGLQPGEKLHESLEPGVSSDQARRMSVDELREELANV
jgi:FlaA1/EpsC-like NDP-sugar epimerase